MNKNRHHSLLPQPGQGFAHNWILLPDYSLKFTLDNTAHTFPVWLNGRAFARDPKGRGFESRTVRFQVTALGKLLTRMCLCHQTV